jgi:hypothetical protein
MSQTFYLQTDSSGKVLGANLYQVINGEKRIVQYPSRVLHENKVRYTVTELELLAIIWSTKKFQNLLLGRKFILEIMG